MKLLVFTVITYFLFALEVKASTDTYKKDFDCLVEAIYFEGRSEPFVGQLAIAAVILNRVRSRKYPNTICGVVHDDCQFSYYCDGKPETFKDKKAHRTAVSVAGLSIDGATVVTIMEATHYHATYVKPLWSTKLKFLDRIGLHKFYRYKKKGEK